MTCSLSCICNTDACLKLQAHQCMTEHMRMYPRKHVLFSKAVEPASCCCGIQECAVFLLRKENCVILIVPLAAVLLSRFIIVSSVLSEHIHDTAVHCEPAVTCICLAAVMNMRACLVNDKVLADMNAIIFKLDVIPRQRTER